MLVLEVIGEEHDLGLEADKAVDVGVGQNGVRVHRLWPPLDAKSELELLKLLVELD